MGMNSAKKARIKHAQKNTPKGRELALKTKELRKSHGKKGQKKIMSPVNRKTAEGVKDKPKKIEEPVETTTKDSN